MKKVLLGKNIFPKPRSESELELKKNDWRDLSANPMHCGLYYDAHNGTYFLKKLISFESKEVKSRPRVQI